MYANRSQKKFLLMIYTKTKLKQLLWKILTLLIFIVWVTCQYQIIKYQALNLSLTAQVIIALQLNINIRGIAGKYVTGAIQRGKQWLEKHFRFSHKFLCQSN